ncbi:unnamed protein product [Cladocopium goreaui]|uniref:RING finger protein 145 n=1 Tax=Cladocopium goreaui TaxID=2562237 RepID=A0A9P1GN21_9DINO|nr:unnamed protein product [Cladocopium goreaui]
MQSESAVPFTGVDFDSIPVFVDDSDCQEPPRRPRNRQTLVPRSRSGERNVATGQSLERQASQRGFPNLRHRSSAPVSIKIDDDLEMIVSNLRVPARPVRARTVRALPSRAVRPDLPALYLEVGHSRSEHCSCCHQNFAAGDVRLGFIMEPNVIPQWVHLGCLRRARLQAVGAEIAMDPQVMLEDRQKALKDLGRRGRHAREIQPWNYLRAFGHQWDTELVRETVEVSSEEKDIAEVLASLPCEQLDASRDICAICHQTMAEGEIVCYLPCGHFYHVGCIDAWLRIRTTCPLDNREIRSKDIHVANV